MPDLYLVVYRCTFDDLPIRILTNYQDAVDLANEQTADNAPEHIEDILDLDASSPVGVGIITFKDGRPSRFDLVQAFN